jgi:hypothetical protein
MWGSGFTVVIDDPHKTMARVPPAISKRDFKALELALVRIIKDSPQPLYAADLHRMIEERTGFDVPMQEFVRRLLKLAHKGAIRSQWEQQPPCRQRFLSPDIVPKKKPIDASPLPLSEVERLRVIREIELSLQVPQGTGGSGK